MLGCRFTPHTPVKMKQGAEQGQLHTLVPEEGGMTCLTYLGQPKMEHPRLSRSPLASLRGGDDQFGEEANSS